MRISLKYLLSVIIFKRILLNCCTFGREIKSKTKHHCRSDTSLFTSGLKTKMSSKDLVQLVQSSKLKEEENTSRTPLLALRLVTLMIIVAMLSSHLRSLKVFRWEQSVTGGILVTYTIALVGLSLCAGSQFCKCVVFQAYLSGLGSVLMAVNAAVIWQRWKNSGDLTHVVAELLQALGVPLKRQVTIKVTLSALAAVLLLIDLIMSLSTKKN